MTKEKKACCSTLGGVEWSDGDSVCYRVWDGCNESGRLVSDHGSDQLQPHTYSESQERPLRHLP